MGYGYRVLADQIEDQTVPAVDSDGERDVIRVVCARSENAAEALELIAMLGLSLDNAKMLTGPSL